MRPSSEELCKLLEYDPDTGILYWRIFMSPAATVGSIAGTLQHDGYVRVVIKGKPFRAHCLIWAMQTGVWAHPCIDHKNRIKSDNRWDNLRQTTKSQNGLNAKRSQANTSGIKNVSYYQRDGMWVVEMTNEGVRTRTRFKQFEAAIAAAKTLPNREFMSC